MTFTKTISYQKQPSSVCVYQLPQPLNVHLPVDEQVETIITQACLEEFSSKAFEFSGLDDADSLCGATIEQLLGGGQASDIKNSRVKMQARFKRFVEEGYLLEDISTNWSSFDERRHFKTSYHGFIEKDCLTRIIAVHRDENIQRLQGCLIAGIAQSLAADSDDKFFSNLVKRLAETLELDCACISEVLPGKKIRFVYWRFMTIILRVICIKSVFMICHARMGLTGWMAR
mgnify:CR=1 FL=1